MASAAMDEVELMSAPAVAASGGGPRGYIAVACIVLTLAFSVMGLFMDSWLVSTGKDAGSMRQGLSIMTIDCSIGEGGDAEVELCSFYSYMVLHEDPENAELPDEIPTVNSGSISDFCKNTEELATLDDNIDNQEQTALDDCNDNVSAGKTGAIILWAAAGLGLIATVLILFNVLGIGTLPVNTQKFGFITAIAAGVLAGIAITVWRLMLPTNNMAVGMNVWLTSIGVITAIIAGVLIKIHGKPPASFEADAPVTQ